MSKSTYPPLKAPIKVDWQSPELRAMKRVLRIEARKSPHGGTPETSIKLRLRGGPPIERLRAARRIGPLELAAAEEIERAVTAISAGLVLRSMDLERLDRGQGRREPASLVDIVARYMRWARVWAQRAASGDQTFRVVRGALIEQQSFNSLDCAIGVREGTAAKATVWGLRSYCAMAGWLDRSTQRAWEEEAANGWKSRSSPQG
jgi:hypothetical protein